MLLTLWWKRAGAVRFYNSTILIAQLFFFAGPRNACCKHAHLQVQPGYPCKQRIGVSTWLFEGVVQPVHTLRASWKKWKLKKMEKNWKWKMKSLPNPSIYIYCCPRESIYVSGNALVSGCNAGMHISQGVIYWYYQCLILNLFEPAVRHNEVSYHLYRGSFAADSAMAWHFVVTNSETQKHYRPVRHAWERTPLLALINT